MTEDLKQFDAYLGDGVYASFDGWQIWLAANDPSNKVVAIDPYVFDNLLTYEKSLKTFLTSVKIRETGED